MPPTALLAIAVNGRSAGASKRKTSGVTSAARAKPSGTHRMLRIAAVMAGSLILVVSLVDPLRGSEQFEARTPAHEQGVRHE